MTERFEDTLKEALRVEIPEESRHAIRDQVMAEARIMLAKKQSETVRRPRRPWHILRPIAVAPAVVALLCGGTALAASGAGPDSVLFPLRQKMEDVRTSLASSDTSKGYEDVYHANERLDDVAAMANEGKQQYVPDLVSDYNHLMDQAQSHSRQAKRNGEDTRGLDAQIRATDARHDQVLGSVLNKVSGPAKSAVERDLNGGGVEQRQNMNGTGGQNRGGSQPQGGNPGGGQPGAQPMPQSGSGQEPGSQMGPSGAEPNNPGNGQGNQQDGMGNQGQSPGGSGSGEQGQQPGGRGNQNQSGGSVTPMPNSGTPGSANKHSM